VDDQTFPRVFTCFAQDTLHGRSLYSY